MRNSYAESLKLHSVLLIYLLGLLTLGLGFPTQCWSPTSSSLPPPCY